MRHHARFQSFLGPDIDQFLTHKRSLGRRYDVEKKTLALLVSGCENPRKDGDESGVSCASLDVGCRAGRLSGVA